MSTVAEPAVTHAPYGSAHNATRQPRHTGHPALPGGRVFSARTESNIGSVDFAHSSVHRRPQNVQLRWGPAASSGTNSRAISRLRAVRSFVRLAWVGLEFG
jgi:hypothetical protein